MFTSGLLSCCYLFLFQLAQSTESIFDYASVAANGTYSCQELQKWSATEKHYSNDRKKSLFQLMTECEKRPVILINNVAYSPLVTADKTYFRTSTEKCEHHDKVAVSFSGSVPFALKVFYRLYFFRTILWITIFLISCTAYCAYSAPCWIHDCWCGIGKHRPSQKQQIM